MKTGRAPQTSKYSQKIANLLFSYRFLLLVISLVIASILFLGKHKIIFEADYKVFFDKTNPQLVEFEKVQNIYTKNDNIFFIIKANQGDVFDTDTLKTIVELTNKAWKIPHAIRVDSVTNYQYSEVDGDTIVVRDLVDSDSLKKVPDIKKLKQIVLNEPTLVRFLIAPDCRSTGINVTLQLPDDNPFAVLASVSYAKKLIQTLKDQHPILQFGITGIAPISASYPEAAQRDMRLLIPLMYGVILLVMVAFLRSVYCAIAIGLLIGITTYATIGTIGWIAIKMTPPTSIVPTIILTIIVADSIHIVVYMLQLMRKGRDRASAIKESLRLNLQPVLLTSVTTMIGFLSFNFSSCPPYRDLGNFAAIGSFLGFCFSLSVLPGILSILPIKIKVEQLKISLMIRLSEAIIKRKKIMPSFVIISACVLCLFAINNRIDDHIIENFDKTFQVRLDSELAVDNLTGIYQIEFNIDSGSAGAITQWDYTSKLEKFSNWLRTQPEVVHVNSFTDVLKRQNQIMNFNQEIYYTIPKDPKLAAQYLLLHEFSLPYGLDLKKQVSMDHGATRLVATLDRLSTQQIIKIKSKAEKWLVDNTGWKARATGVPVIFAFLSHQNIKNMILGTIIALICISITVLIAFKNLRLLMISLIPNIIPPIMGFGVWGALVSYIATPASMVTAACLGLIVDDTIHIISKYVRLRKETDLSREEVAKQMLETVGAAVLITSALLFAGFTILALSPFKMNSDFGLLSAIIVIFALITDLFLLPFLLIRYGPASEVTVVDRIKFHDYFFRKLRLSR